MNVRALAFVAALPSLAFSSGCHDLSGFTTGGGNHYEGCVVPADFVRVGIDATTSMCLTFDADHLQDVPGAITTSDGRFSAAPIRSIPQVWHDALSTFSFGEGHQKDLLYAATASTPYADGNGNEVFVVVSLLQSGDVEVRLLRAVPEAFLDAGTASANGDVFALFDLTRKPGACFAQDATPAPPCQQQPSVVSP